MAIMSFYTKHKGIIASQYNLKKKYTTYFDFWVVWVNVSFVLPGCFALELSKDEKKRLHLIACVLDKIIEPVYCLHLVYIKTEKSNELWKCKKEKLLSLFKQSTFEFKHVYPTITYILLKLYVWCKLSMKFLYQHAVERMI